MADLAELLAVLELREVSTDRFEADHLDEGHGVVFGGQLLAQSLLAATRTLPEKQVLSLHTVFARGASPESPLDIAVETMQAGRAFASVAVTASQGGGRICTRSLVLLHDPSPDLIRHSDPAPAAVAAGPDADDAPPRPGGFDFWDIRVVGDVDISDPEAVGPAELQVWSRFPGAPDDLATSQALLAYASDGFLIGTAMRPHAGVGQALAHTAISTTVLTQTLTFHEPFAAGDWLLLDHRSGYAGRGRSHGTAAVYATDGRLVASFAQTNMIRDFPAGQAPAAGEKAKF
ncbi:MAG: thioesterase family protein [Actinomycetota bacterium]|nr:thioesterase family protein [Acidimicrobiia bacterium]MDQ3294430.1 thioesterase family protein [Actinomycetota bacterium]